MIIKRVVGALDKIFVYDIRLLKSRSAARILDTSGITAPCLPGVDYIVLSLKNLFQWPHLQPCPLGTMDNVFELDYCAGFSYVLPFLLLFIGNVF